MPPNPDALSPGDAISLDDRKWAALLGNDSDALADMLADDLVYIHSNARIENKASYLESIRTGVLEYRKIEISDQHGLVHGSTAVVTGRAEIELLAHGRDRRLHIRYCGVWVAEPQPRLVSWQSTLVPPPASTAR